MHLEATQTFLRLYRKLSSEMQKQVDQTLLQMEKDLSYSSLRNKKMAGYPDIWEVRISQSYRMTYQKVGNIGYLRKVGTHDLLRSP